MIKHKRDHRYDLIKPMVETGKIMFFNDIFKYIPKTVVAKDLGKKVDRFNTLMSRVEEFMLDDLFIMAGFFEIDFEGAVAGEKKGDEAAEKGFVADDHDVFEGGKVVVDLGNDGEGSLGSS